MKFNQALLFLISTQAILVFTQATPTQNNNLQNSKSISRSISRRRSWKSSRSSTILPNRTSTTIVANEPTTISDVINTASDTQVVTAEPNSSSSTEISTSSLKIISIVVSSSCFLIGIVFFIYYVSRKKKQDKLLDIQTTSSVVKGVFHVGRRTEDSTLAHACSFENRSPTYTPPVSSIARESLTSNAHYVNIYKRPSFDDIYDKPNHDQNFETQHHNGVVNENRFSFRRRASLMLYDYTTQI